MAYVNNVDLLEALLQSHAAGHITEQCYKYFEQISEQRINIMLKYDKDQHHEPMKIACVDKCCKVWQNYKFDRDNAFAYFISVIDNTIKLYFMQNPAKIISIDAQEQLYNKDD